ncbi:MAG: hypothetical protein HC905_30670 [Bacteroidales bacterium]|nr:hypothetical protein [Bacteroidales bacterium]
MASSANGTNFRIGEAGICRPFSEIWGINLNLFYFTYGQKNHPNIRFFTPMLVKTITGNSYYAANAADAAMVAIAKNRILR